MTDDNKHSIRKAQNAHRHWQEMQRGERRRKLQSTSKKLGRNNQPKQVRRKNWAPDNLDWDDADAWDDFETTLITSDLGVGPTTELVEKLREKNAKPAAGA